MTVHERDEGGRVLYDLSVEVSGAGLDTSYGNRYQYEIKNGLPVKQFMYPKWPNSKQYTLIIKNYTNLKQIESKETVVMNDEGDIKSYNKITYTYDKFKRVIQENDSSTSRCTSKFCEQIVTKYYYDTLGVKCYIEETKVRNSDIKMLLSKTFLTDSIGKTNRKYYYSGFGSTNYERSEYVKFNKGKNVIRQHTYHIKRGHWREESTIDSVMTRNNYTTYNNINQKIFHENKLENLISNIFMTTKIS